MILKEPKKDSFNPNHYCFRLSAEEMMKKPSTCSSSIVFMKEGIIEDKSAISPQQLSK